MTDNTDPSDGGLFSRDLAPPQRSPWVWRVLIVGIVGVVSLIVWVRVHGSTEASIKAMSPAQREALYKEAWAEQRANCVGNAEQRIDAESRCRQRAAFLAVFPQCDDACRAELAPWLQAAAP